MTITATDGIDTWGTVGVSENVIEARGTLWSILWNTVFTAPVEESKKES